MFSAFVWVLHLSRGKTSGYDHTECERGVACVACVCERCWTTGRVSHACCLVQRALACRVLLTLVLVQRPRCACAGRAACGGRGGPPSSAARGSSSATANRSALPSLPSTSSTTSPEDPPRRPPKTVPKFLAIKRVPDRYIFLCRCDRPRRCADGVVSPSDACRPSMFVVQRRRRLRDPPAAAF